VDVIRAALEVVLPELKRSEGWRDYIYDDDDGQTSVGSGDCYLSGGQYKVTATGGTATLGYGETAANVLDQWWGKTLPEPVGAEMLLEAAETRYFAPIRGVTTAELNPNEWAALISFAYNVGTGGYGGSTVRKVVNAGRPYGGPNAGALRDAFMMWTTGNYKGQLTGRRQAELDLFFTPWDGPGPSGGGTPRRGSEVQMSRETAWEGTYGDGFNRYDLTCALGDGVTEGGLKFWSRLYVAQDSENTLDGHTLRVMVLDWPAFGVNAQFDVEPQQAVALPVPRNGRVTLIPWGLVDPDDPTKATELPKTGRHKRADAHLLVEYHEAVVPF
jgi:GH24 family phage-related lysozyme (muramidase)